MLNHRPHGDAALDDLGLREMTEFGFDRYSATLAEYSHQIGWEDLAPKTVQAVKRRFLDSIGVAVAAFGEDAPTAARRYASELALPTGATLWGTEARVSPEAAAFANGVMVRYLDFNDTYLSLEPLHPSDTIPGLVALCQHSGGSVRDLLVAVAVAYEVGTRLCDAASLRTHRWDHVNYTAIAAACGAGRLLGLPISQIANAISITAVPHAAMRQTRAGELSMWKGAAAANAVRNAVFASLLSRKGFTGPYRPFEGEMGFFRQLLEGESFDPAALVPLEEKAPPCRISDTYIKRWPVEYHAQSAVEAALKLREEMKIKEAEGIESVNIETFKAAYEIIARDPEKWAPQTRETADHSLPYIVAVSLLDATVTKDSFSPAKLRDPRVKRLLSKTTLAENPELTRGYPEGIPNRITVRTTDGRSCAKEVSFPKGHPKNPMSEAEVEEKFANNVGAAWDQRQTWRVIDMVRHLEEQPDLEELLEAMRI